MFLERKRAVFTLVLCCSALILLVFFLYNLSRTKDVITKRWFSYKYLKFLIKKNPKVIKTYDSEEIKRMLEDLGVSINVIRSVNLGVELSFDADWRLLAKVLNTLQKNRINVVYFLAEDVSKSGMFKVKLIVK